ncbi:S26 family signal peptidase [Campylobacter sp. MG1]|uniref:S26 family signal peptidase n=1 Tax=Campylobacter sp. MG1 TaxID=2976332 RepID=UPI00226D0A92|nr:S26 family signal peptidase [Campylobacter sp. MG1]
MKKMPFKIKNKRKFILISFVSSVITLALFYGLIALNSVLDYQITLVTSKSIDNTFIITKEFNLKANKESLLNKIIVFDKANSPYGTSFKSKQLIKYVKCLENDILKVTSDKKYYCNDEFLGVAKDYDSEGKKLDNFVFNGAIPKNKIFVFGTHEKSYDSRYFGFIDINEIKRIQI